MSSDCRRSFRPPKIACPRRNRGRFVKGIPRPGRGRPRGRPPGKVRSDRTATPSSDTANISATIDLTQDDGDKISHSVTPPGDRLDASVHRAPYQAEGGPVEGTDSRSLDPVHMQEDPSNTSGVVACITETNNGDPLRLKGGAASERSSSPERGGDGAKVIEDEGAITDSTEDDTSMQIASSSRQASAAPDHSVQPISANPGVAAGEALRGTDPEELLNAPRSKPIGRPREIPAFQANQAILPASSKLYVCEGCFKYMQHPTSYALHLVRPSSP